MTLEARDLTVRFGGVAALAGVSFAVASGTVTSLIGPNGAGKTTAFNVITGFQRPTQGTVHHDGQPITGWRPHRIAARGLVRTFQKTSLFPGLTVRENVLTGLHLRGRVGVTAALLARGRVRDEERQLGVEADRVLDFVGLGARRGEAAAALSYGYGRDLRQKVAIYDLGGGTFDVSVLEIGEDVFEVLATCGDTYLGGDDFDDRVIDLLADKVQSEHSVNVRSDPYAFAKLRMAAETAKIKLSTAALAEISIPDLIEHEGKRIALSYSLTAKEFDKLTRDLILRTFKVCDEALQQSGLTVRDLNGVILVGGPTRLPSIRKAVKDYFQREPEIDINPDEIVAIGAAIHAASLASSDSGSYLLDVTPLTLRLGIAGGLSEPIIERNSPVPIDHTRVFTTVSDNQDVIAVRIYQGETRQADGNTLLGEFEFSGFEPGPRGQVKIEVTFSISTEGIVTVQARDPKTGAEASTTVSMSSGLSEEQIQEILSRGRTADVVERGTRTVSGNEPVPLLDEGEDVLLDLPSLEADVSELVEKRDAAPLFGKVDTDLAESIVTGDTTLEIERSPTAFGSGRESEEMLSDDEDDKVMGDD